MTDDELEGLLRAHRPAGPPAALRDRILRSAVAGRTWPWAGAAAALLVLTLALHHASGTLRATGDEPSSGAPATPAASPTLRRAYGADLEWIAEESARVAALEARDRRQPPAPELR